MMDDTLAVEPVVSSRDLSAFIRVPWRVNAGDRNWVPPLVADRRKFLDSSGNPFFRSNPHRFFLARRADSAVGRIAAMLNRRHTDAPGERTGFIGFIEAVDDPRVFSNLLAEAERWLLGHGCNRVVGPVNPDMNHDVGILIDGFDSVPYFMLPHNPPCYDDHMRAAGYAALKDFHCYRVSRESYVGNGRLERVRDAVLRRYPVTVRTGDLSQFERELSILQRIYNDAFSRHWGFVPMGDEELRFMAADLKLILDPELLLFAEVHGEPAGFVLALPNLNEILAGIPDGRLFPFGWLRLLLGRRRIRSARILTVAVLARYQPMGIGTVLYDAAARRLVARGYTHAEMSWVMEDNLPMSRAAALMGGRRCRTYRVYSRALDSMRNAG